MVGAIANDATFEVLPESNANNGNCESSTQRTKASQDKCSELYKQKFVRVKFTSNVSRLILRDDTYAIFLSYC